jgi:hypothetical protein
MAVIGSEASSVMGLVADGSGCWDTESYQELEVGEVEVEFVIRRGLNDEVVSNTKHMLKEEKSAEKNH